MPLIVHVIHALRMGGLENGLVNVINAMAPDRFRHAIVCMTEYSEFRNRIARADVEVIALHKERHTSLGTRRALFDYFRSRRPAIVHGRNWDGLDAMFPAWLAGVPVRVQGEHGRDMHDLDGSNQKQQWLRRLNRPFTTHYTTVSRDLESYLTDRVHIDRRRVTQIYNGVDTIRYQPAAHGRTPLPGIADHGAPTFVVGTVGRLVPVKDQRTLIRACAKLIAENPLAAEQLRLVIVGSGGLLDELRAEVTASGLGDRAVLTGARDDVAEYLRAMDVFALPSLGEGISNTLLEAMATGLPVVATNVGGNSELVVDDSTGHLINPGAVQELARWLSTYLQDPQKRAVHGANARARAERLFSIQAMVEGYTALYAGLLPGWSGHGAIDAA